MIETADPGQAALGCPECGVHVAPALLACPSCHRLVHAEQLKRRAAEADRAARAGDSSAELGAWRQALDLLPPDTTQHRTVSARVAALSRALDNHPTPAKTGSRWGKGAAGLGAIGVLLSKLKFALVFVLTKAKLLLLGLTKASTLFSMLLSMGVYWTIWGWWFAVGFVVSIYIHEMGHVQALTRYGIKATAPMFIPGVGAFIRLKQYPTDRREDARVGLAGPIWGAGAAAAAYAVYFATHAGIWGAIAHVGAFINLFNLVPVWQLDGGRGLPAPPPPRPWNTTGLVGGGWGGPPAGPRPLPRVARSAPAWFGDAAAEPDRAGLLQYAWLVAVLSLMTRISVPGATLR